MHIHAKFPELSVSELNHEMDEHGKTIRVPCLVVGTLKCTKAMFVSLLS